MPCSMASDLGPSPCGKGATLARLSPSTGVGGAVKFGPKPSVLIWVVGWLSLGNLITYRISF